MARNYFKELEDLQKEDLNFNRTSHYVSRSIYFESSVINDVKNNINKKISNICANYGIIPTSEIIYNAQQEILSGKKSMTQYLKDFKSSLN